MFSSLIASALALLSPLAAPFTGDVTTADTPAVPETVSVQAAPQQEAEISRDRALAIAQEHAGVTAEQILRVDDHERESDDGRLVWEIEFLADGTEHEFDIDARTGEVLDHERDREADAPTREARPSHDTEGAPEQISGDRALAIAVTHAGVGSPDHVDDLELDHDDGALIWEVEFDAGGLEYEYDIDAHSGAILEFEIDD